MANDYTIAALYDRRSDDELMHYGVIGMRWGVRRYQPYSQGYNPQHIGKFEAKKGIAKAYEHQRNMNWHKRNQAIKADRRLKNTGEITKAEFKERKRQHHEELKRANRELQVNDKFGKEALSKATSGTAEGIYGRYAKEAYKGDPHYSKKLGVQLANKILTGVRAGSTIAQTAGSVKLGIALVAAMGAPALAIPIGALAGGAAALGVNAVDHKIREAITNRFL